MNVGYLRTKVSPQQNTYRPRQAAKPLPMTEEFIWARLSQREQAIHSRICRLESDGLSAKQIAKTISQEFKVCCFEWTIRTFLTGLSYYLHDGTPRFA